MRKGRSGECVICFRMEVARADDICLLIGRSRKDLPYDYPNPFNYQASIRYALPELSDVTITIYDILGRKVETILDIRQQAGYHQVIWNADNFSSGVYFYKLQAEDYIETKKMVLLK